MRLGLANIGVRAHTGTVLSSLTVECSAVCRERSGSKTLTEKPACPKRNTVHRRYTSSTPGGFARVGKPGHNDHRDANAALRKPALQEQGEEPTGGVARYSVGPRWGLLVVPFLGSIGGHRAGEAATCQ